jgi:hypothetical protein
MTSVVLAVRLALEVVEVGFPSFFFHSLTGHNIRLDQSIPSKLVEPISLKGCMRA